jgi:HK97 family phage prohead protease
MSGLRLTFADGLKVDAERRTIVGLAAPYGAIAEKGDMRFTFAAGAIEWGEVSHVKLLRDHDAGNPVGVAKSIVATDDGVRIRFKVAKTAAGDEALQLARDGAADGLSVGVDFDDSDAALDDDGVLVIRKAQLREVSLTPLPSFDGARVLSVAASRTTGGPMSKPKTVPDGVEGAAEGQNAPTLTADELKAVRTLLASDDDDGKGKPAKVSPHRPSSTSAPDDDLVHPLMPSREQLVELNRAVFERKPVRIVTERSAREQFAVQSTADTGREETYLRGVSRMAPLRIAELVGIPSDTVGWGGSANFPVFGNADAAAVTAEGVAKAEYDDISPGAVVPSTIAIWADITSQARSVPSFEAKLRNKLARLVATRENELLRATVAGTAGIVTQSFTAGDQAVQILRAAAGLEAAHGVRPDLLLFNPADTVAIFGTAVSNAAPQELAALSVRVFGMVGLPLATQPAGFVLVGAWAAGSTLVVGNRLTYVVDPFTGLKSNIVTVLGRRGRGPGGRGTDRVRVRRHRDPVIGRMRS